MFIVKWAGQKALDSAKSAADNRAEEVVKDSSDFNGQFRKDRFVSLVRKALAPAESDPVSSSEDDVEIMDADRLERGEASDKKPSAIKNLLTNLFATSEGVAAVTQLVLEDLYGMADLDVQVYSAGDRIGLAKTLGQRMAAHLTSGPADLSAKESGAARRLEMLQVSSALIREFGEAFTQNKDYAVDLTSEAGRYTFVNDLMTRLISKQLKVSGAIKPEAVTDLIGVVESQISLIAATKLQDKDVRVDFSTTDTVVRSLVDIIGASLSLDRPLEREALDKHISKMKEVIGEEGAEAADRAAGLVIAKLKQRNEALPPRISSGDLVIDRFLVKNWDRAGSELMFLADLRKAGHNGMFVSENLLRKYLSSVIMGVFSGVHQKLEADRGESTLEDHLLTQIAHAGSDLFGLSQSQDGREIKEAPGNLGALAQNAVRDVFGEKLQRLPLHKDVHDYARDLVDALMGVGPNLDALVQPQLASLMGSKELSQLIAKGLNKARHVLNEQGEDVYDVIAHPFRKRSEPKGVDPAKKPPALNLEHAVDRELHVAAKRMLKKLVTDKQAPLLEPALVKQMKETGAHEILAAMIPSYASYANAEDPDGVFGVLCEIVAQKINLPGLLRQAFREKVAGVNQADGKWTERNLMQTLVYKRIPAALTEEKDKPEEVAKPEIKSIQEELSGVLVWFRGLGQDTGMVRTLFRIITRVVLRYLAEAIALLAMLADRFSNASVMWKKLRAATSQMTDRRMKRLAIALDARLQELRSSKVASEAIRTVAGTLFPNGPSPLGLLEVKRKRDAIVPVDVVVTEVKAVAHAVPKEISLPPRSFRDRY